MTTRSALAAALECFQRGDAARAIRELEALASRTGEATVYNALGSVLAATRATEAAAAAFRRALSMRPDYAEAHCNLGTLLLEDGQVHAALAACEAATALARAPVQAYLGLARADCLLGRFALATQAFAQAAGRPDARASTHSQRCYASLLDPQLDAAKVVSIHREYETAIAKPLSPAAPRRARDRHASEKLRIGYLSADFREHSVASFIESVLAAHDRKHFEVTLYSDVSREDATTTRLRALVDRYQRIAGMSDDEAHTRIRADGIDVLIDLTGHMQPNRLTLFARRPAPVLLTYLGYPGTTGMSAFAARISDAWADPIGVDGEAALWSEPLVRVEGGLLAYTPPSDAAEVSDAPVVANGFVTFGSFNDVLKLNDDVLATWADILGRAGDARLILKARMLAASEIRSRILAKFAELGIQERRITLLPPTASRSEHLQCYARVDLALDTFPFAGVTTSCEALWMGVPVLTLAGDRHAARLGVSILSAAGLPDLIAPTRAAYVELAVRHARDAALLVRLRHSLRERLRASPLLDGSRPAAAIEHAAVRCHSI